MIQERERLLGRKRRKPQRQPRQVNGHRVQVDPEETPLRHQPAKAGAIRRRHVSFAAVSGTDERRLVRAREEAARGHEKGTAAHRRVHDPERQDAVGTGIADQRLERLANEEARDRPRRIESAGRLPTRYLASGEYDGRSRCGTTRGTRGCRKHWLVVEQSFVHGPELFDAEIPVPHALAQAAGPFHRRQREHHFSNSVIGQRRMFEQRCACRCEEPAIEGRDAQVAGLTAVVCEARDGLEGFPEPARSIRAFGSRTQPLHRVSIAVDRMPRRHEATGLGEAEKQDAVDGRQRLLVERLQWRRPPAAPPATTVEESGQQVLDCAVDTGPEGRAHRLPVRVRGRNRVRESPVGSMRRCRAQAGGRRERNQQASRRLRISGGLQVEVEVPSRKRAAGVEHAQMRAVEQQAPAHVQRQALADRGAPRPVERRAPGGKDDRNRRPVGLEVPPSTCRRSAAAPAAT